MKWEIVMFRVRETQVQILPWLLDACVTLGKLLGLSEFQFLIYSMVMITSILCCCKD